MPLTPPVLDDRTWDQIVAEAKTLIPRYAPEWTNHNDSDPGIALVQLFAWMTEILIYRLNQVPNLNYVKFLQLLGIELKPAEPAHAELTFSLDRADLDSVTVPKGTRIAVAGGATPPLVFEMDEALIALGARLAAVLTFDGFSFSDQTVKNQAPGQWFNPYGPRAQAGSALYLGFDSPLAFTREQVNLAFYIHSGPGAQPRQCSPSSSSLPAPATAIWEYFDGHDWFPLDVDQDATRAFTVSGHVLIRWTGPTMNKARFGGVAKDFYWIRNRLIASSYERAPALDAVVINTAMATQAISVTDEVLGGSDGRPNQRFQVVNTPVVVLDRPYTRPGADGGEVQVTSLQLEIDEGSGFIAWQQVDDFFSSTRFAPHYTLDRTSGVVVFGDGEHGRIPVANPANPNANVVARWYRYGGGKAGNIGPGTITELQTYVPSATVSNLRPAYGGADEESLDDAKLRAPQQLKSRDRAVTPEDFEYLSRQTPGAQVARAKALPLSHPKFPEVDVPGVVTVVVVPSGDAPNPSPNETTLAAVCDYLNSHRLLTCEVYVAPPKYSQVQIQAHVIARPDADLAAVQRLVEQSLVTYFHPLTGGEQGQGWDFGGTVYYSQVYRRVLDVPGVARIDNNQLFIWLDGLRQVPCQDVPIPKGALLYSVSHQIIVDYGSGGSA